MSYDVVIVGASMGGLAAAMAIRDRPVLLVDCKEQIGSFGRCAEGVFLRDLEPWLELVGEDVVLSRVNRVRLHTPRGREVEFEVPDMVVIDRDVFECRLVGLLSRNVDIRLGAKARLVDGLCAIQGETYSPKYLIDASGMASMSRHDKLPMSDRGLAVQYRIEADGESNVVEVYVGERHGVKDGYAWVFPRGRGVFNVGMGCACSSPFVSLLKGALDSFVEDKFSGSRRIAYGAKTIPLAYPRSVVDVVGSMIVLRVGDAGYLCEPVTGEGIANALLSGVLAGSLLDMSYGDEIARMYSYMRRMYRRKMKFLGNENKIERFIKLIEITYRMPRMKKCLFSLLRVKALC